MSGLGTNTWMQLYQNAAGEWMALDLDVPSGGTYDVRIGDGQGLRGRHF